MTPAANTAPSPDLFKAARAPTALPPPCSGNTPKENRFFRPVRTFSRASGTRTRNHNRNHRHPMEYWSVGVLGKNRLDDNTKRGKVRRSFPATFTELGTMDSGLEFKTITPLLHYSINPSSCGMTVNRNRNRLFSLFPCPGRLGCLEQHPGHVVDCRFPKKRPGGTART